MKNLKKSTLLICLMPLALMAQKSVLKSRHLRIENAEVSVHYPGIQGSPIMRKYTVTLKLKKDLKELPDSIYADGFSEKLFLASSNSESGQYKKGTKLTFVANVTINTAENAVNNFYSNTSSVAGEGVCVIRYYTHKKGKKTPVYLRAKTLKKGAEVFAP